MKEPVRGGGEDRSRTTTACPPPLQPRLTRSTPELPAPVSLFANATCAEELLGKAEHRATKLDLYLDLVNQRWNEG